MRLALGQGYSGAALSGDVDRVLEAERLGYDSVWTAESYGPDAVTTIAWIAARRRRCPTRSWTRSGSSGRARGSASGWQRTAKRA